MYLTTVLPFPSSSWWWLHFHPTEWADTFFWQWNSKWCSSECSYHDPRWLYFGGHRDHCAFWYHTTWIVSFLYTWGEHNCHFHTW